MNKSLEKVSHIIDRNYGIVSYENICVKYNLGQIWTKYLTFPLSPKIKEMHLKLGYIHPVNIYD